MVSTLKLTKIQIPNSDSDVLSFNASTGIMTFHKEIKGEGTNTTNLQQGLAKYWVNYNGKDTVSVRDSFNHASLTDRGTGDYTLGFTNNFASNDYCPQFAGLRGATDENYDAHPSFISGSEDTALTTSTLLTSTCYNNSVQADMLQNYVNIDGDLA